MSRSRTFANPWPRRLDRQVALAVDARHGWTTYTVTPRRGAVRDRVLYLHGGGYINEISPLHWSLVAGLAKNSGAAVTVPIYPVAPHGTAETTVAIATDIAAALIAENGPSITVMGDSAGGGLTFAVAQQLRDRGLQARRVVLISAWLDATVSDPRQASIEPHDPMLGIPGLAEAGRLYAGSLDITDPRVSPLNGDLKGLPPITMFSGTHDILNVDAHRLLENADSEGVSIDFHEAAGAQHVYALFPTDDGAAARATIAGLFTS
jgi:monoterpene epsilon-lactone hydrolase